MICSKDDLLDLLAYPWRVLHDEALRFLALFGAVPLVEGPAAPPVKQAANTRRAYEQVSKGANL